MKSLAAIPILGFLSFLASPSFTHAQVQFQKTEGSLEIRVAGQPFATYVWDDPKTTRPYFKNVFAPGGIQVTRNHPPQPGDIADHETFHPGIWWGFGDVGGHDYWRMKAKIIGGNFIEEPNGGGNQGTFAVRSRMLTTEGNATFGEQISRYTIIPQQNGILLVCETTLRRDQSDFWLGDQEEMGLGIRVATPIAVQSGHGGRILDSAGRTEIDKIRSHPSNWCDYSATLNGRFVGILIMNDPANFRPPWWHAVDNGPLVANPLGESELSGRGKRSQNILVEKGQPFRLRYGLFIHSHARPAEFQPDTSYKQFLHTISAEQDPLH